MHQVRANIRATVNHSGIRRETDGGREYLVVPSITLPDDVVMNGIRYPAEEIEKSYLTLENTRAPLGHPEHDGSYLLSTDPRADRFLIGGWNRNVERKADPGGQCRVHIEKWIDVEFAESSEGGRRVLEAAEKGEPIHTSTGLLLELDETGGEKIARNMVFDHDAILLDEPGAATPADGVGMLVNKALGSQGEEIEVVNSALEDAERQLDWALEEVARAADRLERAPKIERIKSAIMEAIFGTPKREEILNNERKPALDKEQFESLSATVNTLKEGIESNATALADLAKAQKAMAEHVEGLSANAKAAEEAEREQLVNALVKGGGVEAADLKGVSTAGLKKLAANVATTEAPKMAANLFQGFAGDSGNDMEAPE